MLPVGMNPQTSLVEVVSLEDHPWFIGVQYHPEYKNTVARLHPLFIGFVKAAIAQASVPGPATAEKSGPDTPFWSIPAPVRLSEPSGDL